MQQQLFAHLRIDHEQRTALTQSANILAFWQTQPDEVRETNEPLLWCEAIVPVPSNAESATESGQGHARDVSADRDESILQYRITGLRIWLHTREVIEIFPGHL
jgi:hypothetical protein